MLNPARMDLSDCYRASQREAARLLASVWKKRGGAIPKHMDKFVQAKLALVKFRTRTWTSDPKASLQVLARALKTFATFAEKERRLTVRGCQHASNNLLRGC